MTSLELLRNSDSLERYANCSLRIVRYSLSHAELLVSICEGSNPIAMLIFAGLLYLDGPFELKTPLTFRMANSFENDDILSNVSDDVRQHLSSEIAAKVTGYDLSMSHIIVNGHDDSLHIWSSSVRLVAGTMQDTVETRIPNLNWNECTAFALD